jgi:hypothetical protein
MYSRRKRAAPASNGKASSLRKSSAEVAVAVAVAVAVEAACVASLRVLALATVFVCTPIVGALFPPSAATVAIAAFPSFAAVANGVVDVDVDMGGAGSSDGAMNE